MEINRSQSSIFFLHPMDHLGYPSRFIHIYFEIRLEISLAFFLVILPQSLESPESPVKHAGYLVHPRPFTNQVFWGRPQ